MCLGRWDRSHGRTHCTLATAFPANPRISPHHFTAPSLSLESRELAGGAETQRLGWESVELVTVCQKANEHKGVEERKESWDGQG